MRNWIILIIYVLLNSISLKGEWTLIPRPSAAGIGSFISYQNKIYAGTIGIYSSRDYGESWQKHSNALIDNISINCFAIQNQNIFAGSTIKDNGGIFVSSDNGQTWQISLKKEDILDVAANDIYVFASTWRFGNVFRSSNGGTEWEMMDFPVSFLLSFAVSGTYLYAASQDGLFISRDNGTNWLEIKEVSKENVPGHYLNLEIIEADKSNIYVVNNANSAGQIFRSVDSGNTWSVINTGLGTIKSIKGHQAQILAGTTKGLFLSTDYGDSWNSINENISECAVSELALADSFYFAEIIRNGKYELWRRPISIATSIYDPDIEQNGYSISQNYPNPFNPITYIYYSLPEQQNVSIKIFDILGNEVAELVNEEKPAGEYTIEFNASSLPSGVYLYTLNAGTYHQTQKLIVIK